VPTAVVLYAHRWSKNFMLGNHRSSMTLWHSLSTTVMWSVLVGCVPVCIVMLCS
jgi:hypothetical protein